MLYDPMTQVDSVHAHPHDSAPATGRTRTRRQEELNRRLDRALEETFPASDPVSILLAR